MNGQWVGVYEGSNRGEIVLDLDDLGPRYAGRIYAYDSTDGAPAAVVAVESPGKVNAFRAKVPVFALDPRTRMPGKWSDLLQLFPNVAAFPDTAEVSMTLEAGRLDIEWTTSIGTEGRARIERSRAGDPTEYQAEPDVVTWAQFKAFSSGLEHRRNIFRGQRQRSRLRTTFHRTGRADLVRFVNEDIPTLHRHLSSRTTHAFQLSSPDENGAFFNLVQHHGYPTPLLDWTFSPYVAAFFAYHQTTNSQAVKAGPEDKVRLFVFDQKQWRVDYPQLSQLAGCHLHFSVLEFAALNNERLIPQQSVSSLTNIDDIESYIRKLESSERKYLRIIDLPLSERSNVMRELSSMGVTAGSLFPGIDGACSELKEQMFPNL